MADFETVSVLYQTAGTRVCRARRSLDGKSVIIKTLNREYPTRKELSNFRNEYRLSRMVQDEAVCSAIELLEHGNTLSLIFDDIGADALSSLVLSGGMEERLEVAIRIAQGLTAIHAAGIIHQDINPANIIYNQHSGALQIVDFGIASTFSVQQPELHPPAALRGTLAYLSPEQTARTDRPIDYHTDFYSLGVTLYLLFVGRLPFESHDAAALVHAHVARQPELPHVVNPAVPAVLSAIISKLMNKAAQLRYQSALGLEADLRKCLDDVQATGSAREFPLATRDVASRFVIPDHLYGRESAITSLLAAFERVRESGTQLTLLSGPSGIGKSSVVRAIRTPLTAAHGYFISGKFDMLQQRRPYTALASALQSLVRQILTGSESQIQSWRQTLQDALGAHGQIIVDLVPELELIIGPQPPVPTLVATELQTLFSYVFRAFLRLFCRPEHPVAIFLDDLQWADSASLKLIESILSDRQIQHLLIIASYRSDEIDIAHPLTNTLRNMRNADISVDEIALSCLDIDSITALVRDTIGPNINEDTSEDTNDNQQLAELIMAKTDGNPFFVKQFLSTLHREGLLTFDEECRCWQWDTAEVSAMAMTDNLAALIERTVSALPAATQRLLALASCVGTSWDLHIITELSGEPARTVYEDLLPALEEQFIYATSQLTKRRGDASEYNGYEFKFAHDRFREVFRQILPKLVGSHSAAKLHWEIGNIYLRQVEGDEYGDHIFDIVNHLDAGAECSTSPQVRSWLACMNLRAGLRAKHASAYPIALQYLQFAIEILPEDSWQTEYRLARDLYKECAECQYLCGDFPGAEARFEYTLDKMQATLEKVDVCIMQLTLKTNSGSYNEALASARQGLSLLGIELPTNEDDWRRLADNEHQMLNQKISDLGAEHLLSLPAMTAEPQRVLMRLLSELASPAYNIGPDILAWVASKMLNVSIDHGITDATCFACSIWAIVVHRQSSDIATAVAFCEVAVKMEAAHGWSDYRAKILHVYGGWISYWRWPYNYGIRTLEESYGAGRSSGDLIYAGFSGYQIPMHQFSSGANITQIYNDCRKYLHFVEQTNNALMAAELGILRQLLQCLIGGVESDNDPVESRRAGSLKPFHYPIEEHEDEFLIFLYYLLESIHFYLSEEYQSALGSIARAEKYLSVADTHTLAPEYVFHAALIYAACIEDDAEAFFPPQELAPGGPWEARYLRERLGDCARQLRGWAEICPENFAHKAWLVEAEIARVDGDVPTAMTHYSRAIADARQYGDSFREALAHELVGRFWLRRGSLSFAQLYLQKAIDSFQHWGAIEKAKALVTRYSRILASLDLHMPYNPASAPFATSLPVRDSHLDISLVTSASHEISSAIQLPDLLQRLLRMMIERTRAHRGTLLLIRENELWIEAETTADTDKIVLHPRRLQTQEQLPISLIDDAVRLLRTVIFTNTSPGARCEQDTYLTKYHPSVAVCVPVVKQGKLIGMAYLEDHGEENTFTLDKIQLLEVLCAQAAISLDNALLYQRMEERVEQRTRALRHANRRMMAEIDEFEKAQAKRDSIYKTAYDIARQSGMAEVAASTLHNIGNVLNSVSVSIDTLIERNSQAKTANLGKVAQLLSQHQGSLRQFLAEGQQGYLVPDYLGKLAQTLTQDHRETVVELSGVADKLSQMTSILAWQESYFGASKQRMSIDPATLLRNALTLTGDAFQTRGIKVDFDIADVGWIQVEQHRVVQILLAILRNAVDAMAMGPEPQGRVLLTLEQVAPERICYRVSDNGIGIAPEHCEQIFHFGFTTKADKRGIGLHVARIAAQELGGTLTGYSGGIGKGAVFCLELPCLPPGQQFQSADMATTTHGIEALAGTGDEVSGGPHSHFHSQEAGQSGAE